MEHVNEYIILALFVIAFIAIIFEEKLLFEKYKTAMFFGLVSWLLLLIQGSLGTDGEFKKVEHAFNEYVLEVSMLWLFLISAMTFVAYLDKRQWIENVVLKALPARVSQRKFLFIMSAFTFVFSGVADNLTATLVALSIILVVLKGASVDTLIRFGVMIIFAANAGGLPLITGDVTTLMIFVAGKIHMVELLKLYVPAIITTLVLYFYLAKGVSGDVELTNRDAQINPIDTKIAVIFIFTIIAILAGHVAFHLPPVLVFLTGLSVMFLVVAHDKIKTKSELNVLHYVQHVEFDALFFFLGVLLLVGALKEVGMLGKLAILYELIDPMMATFFIGILSAIVDNIPITAAMLKADLPLDEVGWMLMTYAVGIGGSILVIGSAAGVVAMSKVKPLTFVAYLRYTPVVFVVYVLGFGITYIIAWCNFLDPGWKHPGFFLFPNFEPNSYIMNNHIEKNIYQII